MPRYALTSLLVILACSGNHAESRIGGADGAAPRELAQYDEVASVVGLPSLESDSTSPFEIRMWREDRLTIPKVMLRLSRSDLGVTGQVFLWWPLHPDDPAYTADVDAAAHQRYRCAEIVDVGAIRACEVPLWSDGDWKSIANELLQLGVATLPDQAHLEPRDDRIILDGDLLTVEVRKRRQYRVYQYYSPAIRGWPEAARVTAMLEILTSLLDQTRRPR